jgi:CheY-like chemotaxis protein
MYPAFLLSGEVVFALSLAPVTEADKMSAKCQLAVGNNAIKSPSSSHLSVATKEEHPCDFCWSKTRKNLVLYLSRPQRTGFYRDVAANGTEGLHLAVEFDYEAIILDVMLPGLDGYSVLKGLRASKNTPVLMLSARGSVDERVKGLRQGADDYLPKPFP